MPVFIKKNHNLHTSSGSITIEAAVALPAFIFVVLGMATIIRILTFHCMIQHALNQTAKIISLYSYLCADLIPKVSSTEMTVEKLVSAFLSLGESATGQATEGNEPKASAIIPFVKEILTDRLKTKTVEEAVKQIFNMNLLEKTTEIPFKIKTPDFSGTRIDSVSGCLELKIRYGLNVVNILPEIIFVQKSNMRLWGSGKIQMKNAADLWKLPILERGKEIQRLEGRNLPEFFPVIAIFTDGKATSVKSIDITEKTYSKAGELKSRILGYVDELANLKSGVYMDINIQIETRELIIVVPEESLDKEITAIFRGCESIAERKGVTLKFKEAYGKS